LSCYNVGQLQKFKEGVVLINQDFIDDGSLFCGFINMKSFITVKVSTFILYFYCNTLLTYCNH
jgi:hypothetical protein